MNKAVNLATTGRPGPVWLDVPLEIQWSDIKFNKKFILKKKIVQKKINSKSEKIFRKIFKYISKSKKPLLILGYGAKGFKKQRLFSC